LNTVICQRRANARALRSVGEKPEAVDDIKVAQTDDGPSWKENRGCLGE